MLYDMLGGVYTNSISNTTNPTNSYERYFSPNHWLFFGLRPAVNIKINLEMFGNYNYSEFLVDSIVLDSRINLIVYDTFNEPLARYYYLRATVQQGSGSYSIESDNPPLPSYLNIATENFTGSFNPNEVLYVRAFTGHEVGRTYNLTLDVPSSMDIDVYIFNETGGRDDAIASSRKVGLGVDETLLFKLTNDNNFTIVFTDENGGSGSFNYEITSDFSAPIASINSPINKSYAQSIIDVNLSSSAPDLATLWYCVRNATNWITGNLTWIPGAQLNLGDGIYTLYAWANDTEGNTQATPSSVVFSVDTTPPTAIIDSPKPLVYSTNLISINLTSLDVDVQSYWYRLYNRTGTIWLDGTNITWVGNTSRNLWEGDYTLYAWTSDAAGNVQVATVSVDFTVNTPPLVTLIAPGNWTYSNNIIPIDLASNATDLSSLWYRIHNGTSWITGNVIWSSGANETLADGSYTIFAWGNDTLGQISVPVSVAFTIDTTAPDLTIDSPQNITYQSGGIWVNLSSNAGDLAAQWYRIYNNSNGNWVDPQNLTWIGSMIRTLRQGIYTIYVWANDTVGNTGMARQGFTIDTPPSVGINAPGNQTYTSLTLGINLYSPSSDVHSLWYSIWNGTGWAITNVTWTLGRTETLTEGVFTLYAWANDTYGLVSAPAMVTFSIDVTAPEVTISAPINNTYSSTHIWVNVSSAAGDLANIWYRIYSQTQLSWIDSTNLSALIPVQRILTDGYYMLYVWANDTFGNTLNPPTRVNFTIDAPPQLFSISILNGTVSTTGNLVLNLSCDATDLHMIWYSLFDGQNCITGNLTWTGATTLNLTNGNYLLYIWANDTQGNEALFVISFSVQIQTPPGGPDWTLITIIIIVVGTVVGIGVFYRVRKSRVKKKKVTKAQPGQHSVTRKDFADRVKPAK